MANPIWLTGRGQKEVNLGTVTEGVYFEYPLDAYDPAGGTVSYKFLAGQLPPGIWISSNSAISSGAIQGGPYLNNVVNETTNYVFSVRASDQNGLISDKSFTMSIANVNPPIITTENTLGEVFDGSFYSLQFAADEFNPYATLTWELVSGSLPVGLSLSTSGLLSGFINPIALEGASAVLGFNATPFNEYSFNNTTQYENSAYNFTVGVSDGANFASQSYSLLVTAKSLFTADNSLTTIDNGYLTIDHDNTYLPIMTTPSQTLPEVRSNSRYAFQFQAIDPNGNQINYALGLFNGGLAGFDQGSIQDFDEYGFDQENLSMPAGLTLDPVSGWLYGEIGAQPAAFQSYNFQVYAFETGNPSAQSVPINYTINILGDITNTIQWNTNANLGIINNGTVSQLSVSATNLAGREISYNMLSGSGLPQGLQLNSSGLIVGKTGFEYFTLDNSSTTVDGSVSGFDNTYNFTVEAFNIDGTASNQQTFTILVDNVFTEPFENIYIKPLPTMTERQIFLNYVNNTEIFPSSMLYRPSDPNFGVANDMRSLFTAGLKPSDLSTYLNAISTNTYRKRILLGDIKTARATDENFNTKYEVVYLPIENDFSEDVLTSETYVYDRTIEQNVYNNSFRNMSTVLSNATQISTVLSLPEWMTSPQTDKTVLGFTRGIVLAYTLPNYSALIAYRLQNSGLAFNNIDFVIDRYDLDNSYSANYNIDSGSFDLGAETTFDRIERKGTVITTVNYGITGVPFNSINGQTVAQINSSGGIDGITDFNNGDTVLFLQQENYSLAYDGWIDSSGNIIPGYTESAISNPVVTTAFPSNPYLGQVVEINNVYYIYESVTTSNITTFLSTTTNTWKVANLRANPWVVNFDDTVPAANAVVTLTPSTVTRRVPITTTITSWGGLELVGNSSQRTESITYASDSVLVESSVIPGDIIQIGGGDTYPDSLVFYNPAISLGQSIPNYEVTQTILNPSTEITTFDKLNTRFINNRISYEIQEVNDTWINFPMGGPLL